jgi:hypothetical protein
MGFELHISLEAVFIKSLPNSKMRSVRELALSFKKPECMICMVMFCIERLHPTKPSCVLFDVYGMGDFEDYMKLDSLNQYAPTINCRQVELIKVLNEEKQ